MLLKRQLEELIDQYGMMRTVDALSNVCKEKASHIEQAYSQYEGQIDGTAEQFRSVAHQLDQIKDLPE